MDWRPPKIPSKPRTNVDYRSPNLPSTPVPMWITGRQTCHQPRTNGLPVAKPAINPVGATRWVARCPPAHPLPVCSPGQIRQIHGDPSQPATRASHRLAPSIPHPLPLPFPSPSIPIHCPSIPHPFPIHCPSIAGCWPIMDYGGSPVVDRGLVTVHKVQAIIASFHPVLSG